MPRRTGRSAPPPTPRSAFAYAYGNWAFRPARRPGNRGGIVAAVFM